MSVAIMTAVWRLDLPPTDKMVLLALADAANDDGVCWTAVRSRTEGKLDLLTKTSLSERAVQGAIKRLCAAGHVSRVERPGKGVLYTVTPAADAPPQQLRPAGNDADPRTSCGETVSNHTSEAKASSVSAAKAERPKRVAKPRFAPEDFAPSPAHHAKAEHRGLTAGDFERALSRFRNHEFRHPPSDWSRAFHKWLDGERPQNVHRPDRHTAQLDHFAAIHRAMVGTDRAEPERCDFAGPGDPGGMRALPSAA